MEKHYEDLLIWKKGFELVKAMYRLTKELPKEELFGLTSQMRRAAVSVVSNIAEGYGRQTQKEFLQFLFMSKGSASELETQLRVVEEVWLIQSPNLVVAKDLTQEFLKMITKFIQTMKQRL